MVNLIFAAQAPGGKSALFILTRLALISLLIVHSWSVANAQSSDIVLYASETTARVGNWLVQADATAAGGNRIRIPDAGGPKLTTPFANPTHFFETTFTAQAG
ncbi:MAG TPA: hypothetical protein VJM12_16305, partial [Pyrinomonadaceae bacterium]|nr:hypothetical protein [Pyrinomonadaceae bacterium]